MGLRIEDILGTFIGANSPQELLNPEYLDENGNPIKGKTPYKTPGFGTKLFHPEVARYVGLANSEDALKTAKAYDEGRALIDKTRAITSPIARFFDSSLTPDELASTIINGGFGNIAKEAINSFALKNQDSKILGESAALENAARAEVAKKNAIANAENVYTENAIRKNILTTSKANSDNDVKWLPTDLATASHNKINALQDASVIKPLAGQLDYQNKMEDLKILEDIQKDEAAKRELDRQAITIEKAKQDEIEKNLHLVRNTLGRNLLEANRQAMHPSTDIHEMYIDRDGKVKVNPFYSNPYNWHIDNLLQNTAGTSTTGTQAPAAIRVAPNVNLRTRPAVKPNISNVVTRPNAGPILQSKDITPIEKLRMMATILKASGIIGTPIADATDKLTP